MSQGMSAGNGPVQLKDGNGVVYPADSTLPSEVVGSVAAGSADTGNPVKAGGKYNATVPALSDGQRGDLQLDSNQRLAVTLGGWNAAASNGFASNWVLVATGNANTASTGRPLATMPLKMNGTNWDMDRKPSQASRLPSCAASVNSTLVKNAAGDVHAICGYNSNAAVRYLKLYNKASAPTVGTDTPFITLPLGPSQAFNFDLRGLYFSTGIGFGITTGATDGDTTAPGAGDILGLNIVYAQ